MFLRLLVESFRRQRRRKALAGVAILLGTTAVTAMLALATTIGDRIHAELAVYGANIVVTPKAADLDVKIGGTEVRPATGGAYLKESDLDKLHGIFWANNITGVSPELSFSTEASVGGQDVRLDAVGLWFDHAFSKNLVTGAVQLHPAWRLQGSWPSVAGQVAVGSGLAERLHLRAGDSLTVADTPYAVSGVVSTGDAYDGRVLMPLATVQVMNNTPGAVSRVEVSARTKPEDAFARQDPEKMSPAMHEIWYCRPYANSIAYQIREAIPGADAQQVRKVEQSEGTVLSRISGLMWLISAAALVAAGFAVSAAMATAVLERRGEIGLMRSLGAAKSAIAMLFYAEAGILALLTGLVGYVAGSWLAGVLGARIFAGDGVSGGHFAAFNLVLLPVVIGLALLVAIAGSTPSIRAALRVDPAGILRSDA